jgi:predicted RNase H-like HicB family nuclease
MEKIAVIVEKTDSGFSAYLPDLPITCTTGGDLNEIETNMYEALDLHLEALKTVGKPIPPIFNDEVNFDYRLDITDFFNLFSPIKQTSIAEKAGINPSLLRQYARGIKHPSFDQAKKIEEAIHKLGRELLKINLVSSPKS